MQVNSAPPRALSSTPPRQQPQPPSTPDELPLTKDDILQLSASLGPAAETLKAGQSLSLNINGKSVVEVVKHGPDFWTGVKKATGDVFKAGALAVAEDPSLAVRQAIEVGKKYFIPQGHPGFAQQVSQGLVPVTRAICLGIDAKKAYDSLNSPTASTTLKIVDTAHAITSAGGVVGSLHHVVPSLAAVPWLSTLSVAATVGDIAAFAVHSLNYFQKFTQDGPSQEPPKPPGSVTVTLPPPTKE